MSHTYRAIPCIIYVPDDLPAGWTYDEVYDAIRHALALYGPPLQEDKDDEEDDEEDAREVRRTCVRFAEDLADLTIAGVSDRQLPDEISELWPKTKVSAELFRALNLLVGEETEESAVMPRREKERIARAALARYIKDLPAPEPNGKRA